MYSIWDKLNFYAFLFIILIVDTMISYDTDMIYWDYDLVFYVMCIVTCKYKDLVEGSCYWVDFLPVFGSIY